MGQPGVFSLVGIVLALMVIMVLVVVSIGNLRKGQQAMARARSSGETVTWHRQLSILFGINNLIFASLIFFILLLALVTSHIWKYIFISLVALFLVLSIILVTRCVLVALQTSRDLVSARRNKVS